MSMYQKYAGTTASVLALLMVGGCAIQAPQIAQQEAPQSIPAQKAAQVANAVPQATAPTLKRKIALGRISNETAYGRSLLRDQHDDPLGKQVTDLMSKAL